MTTMEWALPIELRMSHTAAVQLAELLGSQEEAGRLDGDNQRTLRDLQHALGTTATPCGQQNPR